MASCRRGFGRHDIFILRYTLRAITIEDIYHGRDTLQHAFARDAPFVNDRGADTKLFPALRRRRLMTRGEAFAAMLIA